MSKGPILPGIDPVIGDLLQRVAILEALTPAAGLVVTDGSTTVNPTGEIDIDPRVLALTNPAGPIAELAEVKGTWTPVLTQSIADPTGTWTTVGTWVRVGDFVFAEGQIAFGSGFTNGTGRWELTLPFHWSGPSVAMGSAELYGFLHNNAMQFLCTNFDSSGSLVITFQYVDAIPVGTRQSFDGTAWGATWNGDTLGFTVCFNTHD